MESSSAYDQGSSFEYNFLSQYGCDDTSASSFSLKKTSSYSFGESLNSYDQFDENSSDEANAYYKLGVLSPTTGKKSTLVAPVEKPFNSTK